MLALVGRYCHLWERPALALGHFRAAVEAAAQRGAEPDPSAKKGLAQCTALLKWRAEALSSCMRWWTAPHTAPPYFCEAGLRAFQRMDTLPSDVIMTSYPDSSCRGAPVRTASIHATPVWTHELHACMCTCSLSSQPISQVSGQLSETTYQSQATAALDLQLYLI